MLCQKKTFEPKKNIITTKNTHRLFKARHKTVVILLLDRGYMLLFRRGLGAQAVLIEHDAVVTAHATVGEIKGLLD